MTCPHCTPKWQGARDVIAAHRETLVRLRDEAARDETSAGMRKAMLDVEVAMLDERAAALDGGAETDAADGYDDRWRGMFTPGAVEGCGA